MSIHSHQTHSINYWLSWQFVITEYSDNQTDIRAKVKPITQTKIKYKQKQYTIEVYNHDFIWNIPIRNVLNEQIDLLLGGKFLFLVLNSSNVWLSNIPAICETPKKICVNWKRKLATCFGWFSTNTIKIRFSKEAKSHVLLLWLHLLNRLLIF